MLRSKLVFSCLSLLSINPINLTATEQSETGLLEDNNVVAEQIFEADLIELEIIESPLVSEDDDHGRLHVSPIDTQHHLYPVRIMYIDGWQVNENIFEKELRLKAGEHQIKVVPDFSNIESQLVFMSSQWQEKHIAFTLLKDQDIVVSARLTDHKELKWEVQIYRVVIPIKNNDVSIDTQYSN